ncbi:MAG: hypothetical protein HY821_25690 [Acidobacteria bacterium]|nr:hypothetical protein [Acidobacteriota bacterium]
MPRDDGDEMRPAEFWQEEERAALGEMRRQLVKWLVVFAALVCGAMFVIWWAGSTVQFGAARAEGRGAASYRLFGVVTDAETGEAVPFARISDDGQGPPPHFHAMADHMGHYELNTMAERHMVVVTGLGYAATQVRVGRAWYSWMPSGEERVDVRLKKE